MNNVVYSYVDKNFKLKSILLKLWKDSSFKFEVNIHAAIYNVPLNQLSLK